MVSASSLAIAAGAIVVIALFIPILTGGGQIPISDGIELADNAFKVFDVSGGSNATADNAEDTLTLVAGTGMTITANYTTDTITFNSTGGGGGGSENTSASNLGSGEGVFAQEVLDDLEFKSLTDDGTGVNISSDANEITFNLDDITHDSLTNCVTDGHVLKWRTGTDWGCEADTGGGSGDNLGDHTATTTLQMGSQLINFTASGQTISANSDGFDYDTPSGDAHDLRIAASTEYRFEGTLANWFNNRLTSLGPATADSDATRADQLGLLGDLVTAACADGQVLEYQSSNSTWICATGGGGSGDSLGNHLATQAIDADGYDILLDTDGDTKITNDRDAGVSDDQINIEFGSVGELFMSGAVMTMSRPSSNTEFSFDRDTASTSLISSILAKQDDASSGKQEFAKIQFFADDTTAGAEEGRIDFSLTDDGSVETDYLVLDAVEETLQTFYPIDISISGGTEYTINGTNIDVNTNKIAGSMGCSLDEIIAYDDSTDQWECKDIGTINKVITKLKTADETINSDSTLSNDSHLTATIGGSSETYYIEATFIFNTGATPDIKFGWSVPTGTTMTVSPRYNLAGSSLQNAEDESDVIPFDGPSGGQDRMVTFRGVVYTSNTQGTFAVQWAQNTSDASDTTLLKGSMLRLTLVE